MTIILKGGKVFAGELVDADILVEDGRIKKIGKGLQGTSIDVTGKIVLPGMIDAHVHFREPGGEHKEDFRTGSMAAAAGGVTTVLAMPNTNPPVIDQESLETERKLASKSIVNYGLYAGATKDNLEVLDKMDAVAVKAYIGSSTGSLLLDNPADFVRLLESTEKLVVAHAEDEELLKYFQKHAPVHHKARDNLAALVATSRVVLTANYLGKKVHIAHMSTKEEVDFLRKHKADNITCEVCPHHLFLTSKFFDDKGNKGKMNPPLRSQEDRNALWRGIKEGTVDMVATDHAPHTVEEKDQQYGKAPSGVPGVQTMLPLMLDAANKGKLELRDVVDLCSTNPARIFGLEGRGEIKEGNFADLVVVDMDMKKVVRNEDQYSKCGWTPFHGMELKGWPVLTMVNGQVAFDGEIKEARGVEVGNSRN